LHVVDQPALERRGACPERAARAQQAVRVGRDRGRHPVVYVERVVQQEFESPLFLAWALVRAG
jgi:hypothetical protein